MIGATALLVVMLAIGYRASPLTISNDISWRVVGGQDADRGAFPFIGSLRYWGGHSCGCSLIASKWAITAAHCVESGLPISYDINFGTNQLNDGSALNTPVEQIFIHEGYNRSQILHDIALLKLPQALTLSEEVQTVPLDKDQIEEPTACTLAGWGRTSYPGSIPNNLQFLPLITVQHDVCRASWAGVQPVFDSQICTLTRTGEGACHGDSGGPLIVYNGNVPSLIGLVSWGMACARGYPDVYTRVSSYSLWIDDVIKRNT